MCMIFKDNLFVVVMWSAYVDLVNSEISLNTMEILDISQ